MPANAEPETTGVGGQPPSGWRTVKEVAAYLRVTRERVYDLIASGQLGANDVSDPDARRPSYRVSDAHLSAYLTRTQHSPAGGDRPGSV